MIRLEKDLPQHILERASQTLYRKFTEKKSLAIISYGLSCSELAYEMIINVNSFLTQNYKTEICVYNILRDIPLIQPRCAVYPTIDINKYWGTLLALDFTAIQSFYLSNSKDKWVYVYDLSSVNSINETLVKEIDSMGIKIITRNTDYKKVIESKGLTCDSRFVEYFDIAKIMEIIHG